MVITPPGRNFPGRGEKPAGGVSPAEKIRMPGRGWKSLPGKGRGLAMKGGKKWCAGIARVVTGCAGCAGKMNESGGRSYAPVTKPEG
ncbi:MAG TPA: hypothetical protein ENN63_03810 [Bacteroidetes bacterium]|nr:hypothetical protein [Bacteroidota bacterium]